MAMKLGFVGLKGHVGTVLAGAKQLGDVEVVAASDDDPQTLAAFVKRLPQAKQVNAYGDWRHLIEHSLLDVCCVADENGLRAEQLLALFERGVHVVAEKPLVTTLEDLARVRTAFAKSKSKLTMLLELRHQPKNVRVRELIQRGAIGEVCQVATQKSYKWSDRPPWFSSRSRLGGTIPYIGIHSLDLIRWVTSLEFTHLAAIHGRIGLPKAGETETHASILARLANGASATARFDYLRPPVAATHGDDRLRIIGTKGMIEVNEGDEAISLMHDDQRESIPFGETENLFVEFARFLRGGPAPRLTADECFHITEVVLRARDAADKKIMVEFARR